MFYETERNDHGLRYSPFKSCVVPRPIGWISTLSSSGIVNLAPYSLFNVLGFDPPYVMFSASGHPTGRRKDSVVNAEATGEFVYNMATWDLREAVVRTSEVMESGVDEMALTGLEPAASRLVKPPRVAASPVSFECKYYQTTVLPGKTPENNNYVVIGRVVAVHIKDEFITPEGRVDILKIRPLSRLGYLDYTTVESVSELRPTKLDARVMMAMSGGKTRD
jgi:flavin reductase (DIM6/NTAB) family NADH-FMN oxidoreductase RutF